MVRTNSPIGSPVWRFRNYGPLAAIKYVLYRSRKFKLPMDDSDFADSIYGLNQNTLNLPNEFIRRIASGHQEIIRDIEVIFKEQIKSGFRFKPGTIGESASSTRLLVLAYVLSSIKFENLIETGTQHGLSALYLRKFLDSGLAISKPKLVSFDVRASSRPSIEDVTFEVLSSPARKSFKKKTLGSQYQNKMLFFHDSDHSYENMMYEFKWAFNELKALCIVSDDVDENRAFLDFAPKVPFQKIICKFDSGPSTGVIFRI